MHRGSASGTQPCPGPRLQDVRSPSAPLPKPGAPLPRCPASEFRPVPAAPRHPAPAELAMPRPPRQCPEPAVPKPSHLYPPGRRTRHPPGIRSPQPRPSRLTCAGEPAAEPATPQHHHIRHPDRTWCRDPTPVRPAKQTDCTRAPAPPDIRSAQPRPARRTCAGKPAAETRDAQRHHIRHPGRTSCRDPTPVRPQTNPPHPTPSHARHPQRSTPPSPPDLRSQTRRRRPPSPITYSQERPASPPGPGSVPAETDSESAMNHPSPPFFHNRSRFSGQFSIDTVARSRQCRHNPSLGAAR